MKPKRTPEERDAAKELATSRRDATREAAFKAFIAKAEHGEDRLGAFVWFRQYGTTMTFTPDDWETLVGRSERDRAYFDGLTRTNLHSSLMYRNESTRQRKWVRGDLQFVNGDVDDCRPSNLLRVLEGNDELGKWVSVPLIRSSHHPKAVKLTPEQLADLLTNFQPEDSRTGGLPLDWVRERIYSQLPGDEQLWHLNGDVSD